MIAPSSLQPRPLERSSHRRDRPTTPTSRSPPEEVTRTSSSSQTQLAAKLSKTFCNPCLRTVCPRLKLGNSFACITTTGRAASRRILLATWGSTCAITKVAARKGHTSNAVTDRELTSCLQHCRHRALLLWWKFAQEVQSCQPKRKGRAFKFFPLIIHTTGFDQLLPFWL